MFTSENVEKVFEGFLSDFSTRDIDDALHAHAISRIEHEAHIGEDILDLLSFIELHSSKDAIGDIFANQRLFYESGLTIGSVEDSESRVISFEPPC